MTSWASVTLLFLIVLALIVLLVLLAMQLMPPSSDAKWSTPIKMANVDFLLRWNGNVVGIGGNGTFHFLNEDGTWAERNFPAFGTEKNESRYPVVVDEHGPKAVFFDVIYINKVEAVPTFVNAVMTPDGTVSIGPKIPLKNYVQDLNNSGPSNSGFKRKVDLLCHDGMVEGSVLYIPYVASTTEITERVTSAGTHQQGIRAGPSECGLFYSSDWGSSWQKINVGTLREAGQVAIRSVNSQLYLLAAEYPNNLWLFTKTLDAPAWSEPKLLTDTLKAGSYFLAETEDDTLHLCWMDMHLKRGLGFFIFGDWDVGRKNNQVFYRNCRDVGGTWSKGKKLSGNLSYCEMPSMSVEGRKIIVVWHNIETLYTRAAIYYAISKNNGKTWSGPTKVLNSENVAGDYPCPKVILHHGIIHLFYAGMYQQREFPD